MLSLFRKTRRELSNNKQFLNYSRYAIGEIFLVVIGILIALQVNNCNDSRKKKENFKRQLVKVKDELETNISVADATIQNLMQSDISLESLRNDPSIFSNDFYAPYTIFNTIPFDTQDEDYKSLKELDIEYDKAQDTIMYNLTLINNNFQTHLSDAQENLKNVTLSNYEKFSENDWFDRFISYNWDSEYDYEILKYFRSQSYKNLVVHYSIHQSAYANSVKDYRIQSLETYRIITKYLHQKDTLLNYKSSDYENLIGTYRNSDIGIQLEISPFDEKLYMAIRYTEPGMDTFSKIYPLESEGGFVTYENDGFFHFVKDIESTYIKWNMRQNSYYLMKIEESQSDSSL